MVPGKDDPAPEEGPILSPEELDLSDDEHVEEIEEGRYVVSPEVRTEPASGPVDAEPAPGRGGSSAPGAGDTAGQPGLTDATVHEWLHTNMGQTNSRYGFDVTAKFGSAVSQQQMVSNDIVTVFESLMLWYARQIDGDTPIEEVLGILLNESNVPVRYPAESLSNLVHSTNLSEDDSIGDLLEAVGDDDGVQL